LQNLDRFLTTSDFDREYLQNETRYQKSERRDLERFLPRSENKSGEFGPLSMK